MNVGAAPGRSSSGFRHPAALGRVGRDRRSGFLDLPVADAAAFRSAPVPLAQAFLALGDHAGEGSRTPRRSRLVAAGAAVVALALATPLAAAGLAAPSSDHQDAATLPGKTSIAADDDVPGDGPAG